MFKIKNGYQMFRAFMGAFGYYMLYLCTPVLLMAIGMMIRDYDQSAEEFFKESGNFYTVLGFGVVIVILYMRCRKKEKSMFDEVGLYPKKVKWKKGLGVYLFGMAFAIAISAIITLLPLPSWLKDSYQTNSTDIFKGTDVVLIILATGILAPFFEEIIFRGYMFNKLLAGFSEKMSIIIVSVMFAILHLNPIWIIYAFVMGLILAKISLKEDNIAYSVLMHLGFNFPAVFNYLVSSNDVLYQTLYGSKLLIVLYGMIGTASVVLLYKLYHKEEEVC